ncbi:hypothetical protein BURKHO8Y_30092 [Burkholderia sp. 8Y]|nr:hypothetical protein BURKHO8Y_30092 [Burkholderia sp. 8Y]
MVDAAAVPTMIWLHMPHAFAVHIGKGLWRPFAQFKLEPLCRRRVAGEPPGLLGVGIARNRSTIAPIHDR